MRFRQGFQGVLAVFAVLAWAIGAQAADRDKMRAFLEITGFDVAIESLQQGAMAGPGLAGTAPSDFGLQWTQLAERIFAPDEMITRALDMMEAVMPVALVDHGASFYASALGQRLVEVENAAHMAPDAEKYAEAQSILEGLVADNAPRLELFGDMNAAIGGMDNSVRSVIELQVRYLLAASRAGAIDMDISEEDLRGMFQEQAPAMRREIELYAMLNSAYAYRDLSDQELTDYVAALEQPEMRQVYEVLNAIQFEIMAERYERLAAALAKLHPQQDL
ncbi:hypothetical protein [Aliiroseovarius subalbicans]|uniref:hypothetical protein n=1 Tax=Aliiroseovarius subalbicans TaxID=2925840 RepID=UPI001F5718A2|nr:hypothetical protein [Aliiroseovarius subalbicans]MCI2398297.1 hypothetical protein [Aliiroseovarius subalbicans]